VKKFSPSQVHEILKSRVSPRYFEIGDRMVDALPELSSALEDYFASWKLEGEPGPINLTDEILLPFVEKRLEEQGSEEVLGRAFEFIEQLAADPEAEIREVAAEIVSCLAPHPKFRDAVSVMGPRTREMAERST